MATALNRWEPTNWLSFGEPFDRIFEDSFVRPFGFFGMRQGMNYLPIDLYETNDAFVIHAWVPGVSSDNLSVTLQGNTVTLHTERPAVEQEGVRYHLREHSGGTWTRTLQLPVEVDADNVEAHLENGILILTLPKAPEAKPHRIAIKAA